jgi:hypothetical protein
MGSRDGGSHLCSWGGWRLEVGVEFEFFLESLRDIGCGDGRFRCRSDEWSKILEIAP